MKITVLTVCPKYFDSFAENQVVARAVRTGKLELHVVDIREFTKGSFRAIDDSPYGGGTGMLLRVDALCRALDAVKTEKSHVALMSPKGKVFNQSKAVELAGCEELVIVCGHYEGVDSRFEKYADELISIGDYILTGGEAAAMVVCDSIGRLLDNVLKDGVVEDESFSSGLLEGCQYTHPYEFCGDKVPDVLLSGNHAEIEKFRKQSALSETLKYRPDLVEISTSST